MLTNSLPFIKGIKGKKSVFSAFEGTIVEMSYLEIEQAALGGAALLFPIGALQEYGPHLPIGTNTYLTLRLCKKIKETLHQKGQHPLIAPPLYWGRNHATGSFTGSFNLRSQTMIGLLLDLLSDLKRWGFQDILLLNLHTDSAHSSTLIESIRLARKEGISVTLMTPDRSLGQYGLAGSEAYVVVYQMPSFAPPSPYVDLHAGSFETSWMSAVFPQLVNQAMAKHLQPTLTTPEDAFIWSKGWDTTKKAFPLGYCGDPAQINIKKAKEFELRLVEEIVAAILKFQLSNTL